MRAAFAGLVAAVTCDDAAADAAVSSIYRRDLPHVTLDGWELTVVELTFPPGARSVKHVHPRFVVGYVLEGEPLFQIDGEAEKVLSSGEVFFEPVGAIHTRAESADSTKPARAIALVFGAKGQPLTKPS